LLGVSQQGFFSILPLAVHLYVPSFCFTHIVSFGSAAKAVDATANTIRTGSNFIYDISPTASSLSAVATLPAVAFLVVIHRTVLATLFAVRLVRGKGDRAQGRDQNRKQDFRVFLHGISFILDVAWR
jgi:hypothetical protein